MVRKEIKLSNNCKLIHESFTSVYELVDLVKTKTLNADHIKHGAESVLDRLKESFHGVASKEKGIELITKGWETELPRVKKIADRLLKEKLQTTNNKYKVKSEVVGVAPNVPNALKGLPNAMFNISRTSRKIKFYTL